MFIDYFGDTRVDDHFTAKQTGAVGCVKRSSGNGNAVVCRLHDGVFFGVAAEALGQTFAGRCIAVAARAAAFVAVFDSARRTVISSGNDPFILHQHRSDVAAALRKAGVKVEMLSVPQRVERGRSEDLWRMSYASFERMFAEKGRNWLPDLIYFTDDHCFQGAAMSLLKRGISVPEDVRLVTETNAGMRPPFHVSVACMENDLQKSAKTISAAVLDYLDRGRKIPGDLFLDCEYAPGDTFP